MSILQEALRRKEAEQSGDSPTPYFQAERPPVPDLPPDLPPSPPPRPGRFVGILVGILILIVAGMAAAGYLLWQAWARSKAAAEAPKVVETTRPVMAETRVEPGAVPPSTPVPPVEPAPPVQPPVSPAPVPKPTPPPEISQPTQPVPVPVPAIRAEVKWPELLIRGVFLAASDSTALINGDIVRVGDEVRGVRILKIADDAVTLQFGGETRTLRGGQSTLNR
ncbi:MAG: hypothetical protein U1E27_09060 [Kiritimatiellia bacterium]|nr:hypothetical protein [Kiritimatiellia bacterium]